MTGAESITNLNKIGRGNKLVAGLLLFNLAISLGAAIHGKHPKKSMRTEVDAAFAGILEAPTEAIGSQVVAVLKQKQAIYAQEDPYGPGGVAEIISFDFVTDQEIIVDVAMGTESRGHSPEALQPADTYYVDVKVVDCEYTDQKHISCGGAGRAVHEIEMGHYQEGWEIYGNTWSADRPSVHQEIDSHLNNPKSGLDSQEVQQALSRTRIWKNILDVYVEQALAGEIEPPNKSHSFRAIKI